MTLLLKEKLVKGKKDYICENCSTKIHKGERHLYCAGVDNNYDGFYTYRLHQDCNEAFMDWLSLMDSYTQYEGTAWLIEEVYDPDFQEWVLEYHPTVASRLKIKKK